MTDRTGAVFGNVVKGSVGAKAERSKAGYLRRFGAGARDAGTEPIRMGAVPNPTIGEALGVRNLAIDGSGEALDEARGVIIGNIRMGYGHYRIAMAMASVVRHRGYAPYWFDLNGYDDTVAGRVVSHLDGLYSMGSRLSQRSRLFNRLVWEPLNYEGFKKLSYNAADQKVAELYAPLCSAFPRDMPMITTHGWPAQAALHSGMTRVVNAVVDNWPMALHLAEGATHAVQGPSAYLGYRLLREMLYNLPLGDIYTPFVPPDPHASGLALVEGWRGEIVYWVQAGKGGEVNRCMVRDPSSLNWLGLEQAIHGNIVPDFPVCNKSFNQSYSGNDL